MQTMKTKLKEAQEASDREFIDWFNSLFPVPKGPKILYLGHEVLKAYRKEFGDDDLEALLTNNEVYTTKRGVRYVKRFIRKRRKK